jgi:hypothetical protein
MKKENDNKLYGFCCLTCGWEQITDAESPKEVEKCIAMNMFGCNCTINNSSTTKNHELVIIHRHIPEVDSLC